MKTNTVEIKIVTEYIELQQLLKKANIVSSGGEVKFFLMENEVAVDGVNENRRGRKLYPGSEIFIKGVTYLITK